MITGLQTLRIVGLLAAFALLILVLPATFVATGRFSGFFRQVPSIGLILLGGVGAGLGMRWIELRDMDGFRTAEEFALAYRTRFFIQAGLAQIPGLLALFMTFWARPYPGYAVMLGVLTTAGLVALVAPTDKTLERLEDEARRQNIPGSVRGALDELYSWRP